MGVLCTRLKLLSDLQILECELHKSAFGGRATPGPPSRYKGEGKEGRGRKGLGIGRNGKGKGGMARLGYLSRGWE